MSGLNWHRCSYRNCKTGLPGVVIPIAQFKAMNAPAYMPTAQAVLEDMRLCESCALSADIHDIINDKRWKDICHQIAAQGGTPPDRSSLTLHLGWHKDQPPPECVKQFVAKKGPLIV